MQTIEILASHCNLGQYFKGADDIGRGGRYYRQANSSVSVERFKYDCIE